MDSETLQLRSKNPKKKTKNARKLDETLQLRLKIQNEKMQESLQLAKTKPKINDGVEVWRCVTTCSWDGQEVTTTYSLEHCGWQ